MKLARFLLFLRDNANPIVESAVTSFTTLTNPQFELIDTTTSNDLSSDGFTWSQAHPIVLDQYSNLIIDGQRYNSNSVRNGFIFKNVSGEWEDNTGINDLSGFGELLIRRSFAYDATNDLLHGYAYFNAEVAIYRRYTFTRSGNDIDTINWTRNVDPNLVFCETVSTYSHPIVLIHDEQILCIIGISNAGDSQVVAVRADANDTDALTDFTNIGYNSTNAIATILTASYSTIATNTVNENDTNPSAMILDDGTLFVVYADNLTYKFKRVTYNGSSWNTLGSEQTLSNIQISGTDTGYSLKSQLTSLPIQIGDDIYIAIAVWASNVLGDTVKLCKIASDDTVTSVNVYSADGAHSYAPTMDIAYLNGRIVVTYLESTSEDTFGVVYDTDMNELSRTKIVDTIPVDIPLIAPQSIDGKMLVMFREQGSPPQVGYVGTIDYA